MAVRSVLRWLGFAAVACSSPLADDANAASGSSPPPVVALRRERDTAQLFAASLRGGDAAAAAALFGPALARELPPGEFERLWREWTRDAGRLKEVRVDRGERIGSVRAESVAVRFAEARISFALLLDGQWRVVGLGVASENPPVGFPKQGLRFGSYEELASKATRTLAAHVVEADGGPVRKAMFTFWKAVGEDAAGGSVWRDPATGRFWQAVTEAASDDRDVADRLEPGLYRVTASGGHEGRTPFGIGAPVTVDAEHSAVETEVRLIKGGGLTVRTLDAATGEPVLRAAVSVRATGDRLPPDWAAGAREVPGRPGEFRLDRLPPGAYEVIASRSSWRPDDLAYELVGRPAKIEIEEGDERTVELRFTSRPQTDEEFAKRWPWLVFGKVTDDRGRPVPDAVVALHSGMGTLFRTGAAVTDEAGEYRLRFGGGMAREGGSIVAIVAASKPGMQERNLNRHGDLAMAYTAPEQPAAPGSGAWDDPERLLLPNKPRELNFVLVPAANLYVRVRGTAPGSKDGRDWSGVGLTLKGREMSPGSSVVESDKLAQWGETEFHDVPTGHEWYVTLELPDRREVRTQPFHLERPQRYALALTLMKDPTGLDVLAIDSLTDGVGRDEALRLVGDDPFAHPPAPEAEQVKARELLRRVAQVNRLWLAGPPPEVKEFSYEFRLGNGEPRRYAVDEARKVPGVVLRGIAYGSGVAGLAADPERVVFRTVEIDKDAIRLSYTHRERVPVSAGNGVLGSYAGFFSMGVRDGVLTLDTKTLTVREHEAAGFHERFGDYVEVAPETFVPRSVEVDHGGMRFRWKFKVYRPGLWLFDRSLPPEGDGEPKATVADVRVNKEPAEELSAGGVR